MIWQEIIEVIGNCSIFSKKMFLLYFKHTTNFFHRFITGSTKWDDYRFYHWAGIDYFCYFSHSYITIPTLSWINAAHNNGVKVLGTIIVESSRGRILLDEILQSRFYMSSVVESLVLIAKSCQFEGWLLNVECSLDEEKIPMLKDFVDHLTFRMHQEVTDGIVLWYDSIIESGALSWQNELNARNKSFFDLCDGILINYAWNEKNLERTQQILEERGGDIHKVFVGIDVFGRGQVAKFESHLVSINFFCRVTVQHLQTNKVQI